MVGHHTLTKRGQVQKEFFQPRQAIHCGAQCALVVRSKNEWKDRIICKRLQLERKISHYTLDYDLLLTYDGHPIVHTYTTTNHSDTKLGDVYNV